jgi:hypothetical protein
MILLRLIGFVLVVIGLAATLITGFTLITPQSVQPDYSYELPRIQGEPTTSAHTLTPPAPAPGKPIGVGDSATWTVVRCARRRRDGSVAARRRASLGYPVSLA